MPSGSNQPVQTQASTPAQQQNQFAAFEDFLLGLARAKFDVLSGDWAHQKRRGLDS